MLQGCWQKMDGVIYFEISYGLTLRRTVSDSTLKEYPPLEFLLNVPAILLSIQYPLEPPPLRQARTVSPVAMICATQPGVSSHFG